MAKHEWEIHTVSFEIQPYLYPEEYSLWRLEYRPDRTIAQKTGLGIGERQQLEKLAERYRTLFPQTVRRMTSRGSTG